jgi:hypothetical protein
MPELLPEVLPDVLPELLPDPLPDPVPELAPELLPEPLLEPPEPLDELPLELALAMHAVCPDPMRVVPSEHVDVPVPGDGSFTCIVAPVALTDVVVIVSWPPGSV